MRPLDVLIDAQIEAFSAQFSETGRDLFVEPNTGKLIHPGEFGAYREGLIRNLLSLVIPDVFGVCSGFVVAPSGQISRQCDVIIYDRTKTPSFCSLQNQRFLPIETVAAVIEVKSVLRNDVLRDAATHLVQLKTMREELLQRLHSERGRLLIDQIGTFVLCDSFESSCEKSMECYDHFRKDADPHLCPNMIVSIKEGGFCYSDKKSLYWPFPVDAQDDGWTLSQPLPLKPIGVSRSKSTPIKMLLRYISLTCEKTKTVYPELTNYFTF